MSNQAPHDGIVDLHAHHVARELIDAIRKDDGAHNVTVKTDDQNRAWVHLSGRSANAPLAPGLSDIDKRLAWMDEQGVAVQLLAGWMDLSAYNIPVEDAKWFTRLQNETLTAYVQAHPGRFFGAAAVPLQGPHAAAAELEYAVKTLGMRAVQIGADVDGMTLDDASLDPFWEAASGLDVAIVIHPVDVGWTDHTRRYFLHISHGNPSATTAAAAALMLGGVLERFPKLRFLLVHGGGFLPYQFSRFERSWHVAPPANKPAAPHPPSHYVRQFYFDTMIHDAGALQFLARFAGPDRVVFGSDYPFPMGIQKPNENVEAVAGALGQGAQALMRESAITFLQCNC
ncbi:MAG TPA: amidohydrolase family protein [Candidatus Binatia bacterium]|nr:amidohydrolase family protein [Candidatus Binatia bacterium]